MDGATSPVEAVQNCKMEDQHHRDDEERYEQLNRKR